VDDEVDDDDILLLEPRALFDPCLLGYARRFNQTFAVYSEEAVLLAIAGTMEPSEGEDPEDLAREYFEFNVVGGWVGEGTPAFLSSPPDERDRHLYRVAEDGTVLEQLPAPQTAQEPILPPPRSLGAPDQDAGPYAPV